jgi:lysozyme
MPIADSYLNAIRRFEGWNPRPYWDHRQWSIGYGTRGRPGETIDREEGERRLNTELTGARDSVRRMGVGMSPGREAALTSLTYNAGPGWQNAGLGRAVRDGNWDDARSRFLQYTNASGRPNQGLINRRRQEAAWLNDTSPMSSPMGVPDLGAAGVVDPMNPEIEPTGPAQPPTLGPGPLPSTGPTSGVVAPQQMPSGPAPEGEQQGGYFERLMSNPMFMAGLSILGTQPGGNWGPNAAQTINQTQRAAMQQREYQRLESQRRKSETTWNAAFPNGQPNPEHPLLRGIPADLLGVVQALGPDQGLPTLQKYALTRSTRGLQEDLQRAQINYYNARSQAQIQSAQAREQNAATRQQIAQLDRFQQLYGGENVSAEAWNAENQEGGLIHAVFGRTVPFEEREQLLQQVQARRQQLDAGEGEPTPEELNAAGITPEMRRNRDRQRTIDRFYGGAPRNFQRRPDGSVETIPGYGTQSERQGETTARQGLAMLDEAERLLSNTNTWQQLWGDTWFQRPDRTGGVGGVGEAGRGFRGAKGAIINLVFALSGKQVSNAERSTFMDIYMPSSLDTSETQKWKMERVRTFFQAVVDARRRGATDDDVRNMLLEETERGNAGPDGRAPAERPRQNRSSGGGRDDPLGIR